MREYLGEPINFDSGNAPYGEKESGRYIFDINSITGLNQIPVISHQSYITAGASFDGDPEVLPVKLDDLVEGLIVDGTVVINRSVDPEGTGEIMTGIIPGTTPERIVQDTGLVDFENRRITRVYVLEGEVWQWKEYVYWQDPKQRMEIGHSTKGIAKEYIYVYMNGAGLLYEAQYTFRRLEEIEKDTRSVTRQLKIMIVAGFTGDMDTATSALNDNERKILKVPKKVEVYFPTSTAVVDQLETNFQRLVALYFKRVNMVHMDDSSEASGVARRLVMAPMLNYIDATRTKVEEIYEHYDVKVTFDRIVTMTVEERKGEIDIVDALFEKGVYTLEQRNDKLEALG